MTPQRRVSPSEWRQITRALATLGLPVSRTSQSVRLQRAAVRRGFRREALRSHPDRAASAGMTAGALAASFRTVKAAYDDLAGVLGGADELTVSAPSPRTRSARPRQTATRSAHAVRPQRARPLPNHALLLGQLLILTGRVTRAQLHDALRWQRARHRRVGQIAQGWGYMTFEEVSEVLRLRRDREPFCQAAVRLGYLTHFQQMAVLGRQHQHQIGRWFLKNGLLSEAEIRDAVGAQLRHNARQCA
jgi:hypothetical protein